MGGLLINEDDAKLEKDGTEIIKGLSKKIATLQILDILNFSRPAILSSPITLHQCIANDMIRTDLLNKAYSIKNDPIERMKYLFAYTLSGVHCNPLTCLSRAPFNPILGETSQSVHPVDGSSIYL